METRKKEKQKRYLPTVRSHTSLKAPDEPVKSTNMKDLQEWTDQIQPKHVPKQSKQGRGKPPSFLLKFLPQLRNFHVSLDVFKHLL